MCRVRPPKRSTEGGRVSHWTLFLVPRGEGRGAAQGLVSWLRAVGQGCSELSPSLVGEPLGTPGTGGGPAAGPARPFPQAQQPWGGGGAGGGWGAE